MSLQPSDDSPQQKPADITDPKVQLELVSQVLQDLDKHKEVGGPDDVFVSEKGLRLRMLPINQFIVKQVMQSFNGREPQPPTRIIGGRATPDKDDPKYREALFAFQQEMGFAAMGVYCGYGTEIIDVPDGMDRPEATRWASRLKGIGIPINDDVESSDRYFSWLKFYALGEIETARLCAAVMKLNGVLLEVEAQAAEEVFRDQETRGEVGGRVPEEPAGDGDNSPGQDVSSRDGIPDSQ